MTTTTTTAGVMTPDPADIAEFRQQLTTRPYPYAYAAGYLISLIDGIAADHRCRKADCMICHRLRRGLALVEALDAIDADQVGGAS